MASRTALFFIVVGLLVLVGGVVAALASALWDRRDVWVETGLISLAGLLVMAVGASARVRRRRNLGRRHDASHGPGGLG